MEDDWENLTDPILLAVFSYLDKHELNSVCRTCKNWCRIAQDESLWKGLVFKNVGCRYNSRHDESWKSELKRLTYHTPKRLHQTCDGHVDEIYYVCFSNTGQLIATCGADGNVKVWQYGNNTKLLLSRQVLDPPSYANYVEFNEAETHILVNCIARDDGGIQAILAILSIEKDLAVVAARNSWFPNFRGTWLHNDTFLIADVLAFFFSNDNVKLVACTFYDDLDDPLLLERPLVEHLADDNVDLRSILEMERDEYQPHFVKVIDWSKWNQDKPIEHDPNSSRNEKVVILFQESLEWDIVHRVVFYKLDMDCEVPNVTEPMKIIVINSGCMGVNLAPDHRDIAYNFRRIHVDGDNSCYEKDVHTMVVNLANSGEKPEIFEENKALEQSTTLFYFFPSVSPDFIASGSEHDVAFLWDRHSKLVIAQLPHKLSDPSAQNGVSCVTFHPCDQEVLVSVADDYKVRIWMSANRENSLQ